MSEKGVTVPFAQCLIHESGKAYKAVLIWICIAIDIVALVATPVLTADWYYTLMGGIINRIDAMVSLYATAAIGLVSTIPLWAVVGGLAISSPFLYSLCICTWRRFEKEADPETKKAVRIFAAIFIGISFVFGLMAVLMMVAYYLTGSVNAAAGAGAAWFVLLIFLVLGDNH